MKKMILLGLAALSATLASATVLTMGEYLTTPTTAFTVLADNASGVTFLPDGVTNFYVSVKLTTIPTATQSFFYMGTESQSVRANFQTTGTAGTFAIAGQGTWTKIGTPVLTVNTDYTFNVVIAASATDVYMAQCDKDNVQGATFTKVYTGPKPATCYDEIKLNGGRGAAYSGAVTTTSLFIGERAITPVDPETPAGPMDVTGAITGDATWSTITWQTNGVVVTDIDWVNATNVNVTLQNQTPNAGTVTLDGSIVLKSLKVTSLVNITFAADAGNTFVAETTDLSTAGIVIFPVGSQLGMVTQSQMNAAIKVSGAVFTGDSVTLLPATTIGDLSKLEAVGMPANWAIEVSEGDIVATKSAPVFGAEEGVGLTTFSGKTASTIAVATTNATITAVFSGLKKIVKADGSVSATAVNIRTSGTSQADLTFLTPDENIGTGAGWEAMFTYTPAVNGVTAIDAIVPTFAVFGGGGWQGATRTCTPKCRVTITDANNVQVYQSDYTDAPLTGGESNWMKPVTFTLANRLTLTNTFTVAIAIWNGNVDASGYFVGLKDFDLQKMAVVEPEPDPEISIELVGHTTFSDKTTSTITVMPANTNVTATLAGIKKLVLASGAASDTTVTIKTDGTSQADLTFLTPNENVEASVGWEATFNYTIAAGYAMEMGAVTPKLSLFGGEGWQGATRTYSPKCRITITDENNTQVYQSDYTTVTLMGGVSNWQPFTFGLPASIVLTNTFTVAIAVWNGGTTGGGCFVGLKEVNLGMVPDYGVYLLFDDDATPALTSEMNGYKQVNLLAAPEAVQPPEALIMANGEDSVLHLATDATCAAGVPTAYMGADAAVTALTGLGGTAALTTAGAGELLTVRTCVTGETYTVSFLFANSANTFSPVTLSADGLANATWHVVASNGATPVAGANGVSSITVAGAEGQATDWALVSVAFTAVQRDVTFSVSGATSITAAKIVIDDIDARQVFEAKSWNPEPIVIGSVTNYATAAWSTTNWLANAWGASRAPYTANEAASFALTNPRDYAFTRSVIAVDGVEPEDVSVATGTYFSYTFVGTTTGLSGFGGLTKTGASAMTLEGTHTFTGPIIHNGGGLLIKGTIAASSIRSPNAGGGNVVAIRAPDGTSWYELSADIQGVLPFDKRGVGTLSLTGDNTYSAATVVHQGTLRVDGSHTGGSAYTVRPGAYLGGVGVLGSSVTISGGVLRSGIETGLTVNNTVTLSTTTPEPASVRLAINRDNAGVFKPLVVNGTLNAPSTGLVVDCPEAELCRLTEDSITLVRYTALSGATALDADSVTAAADLGWTLALNTSTKSVTLTRMLDVSFYEPATEPSNTVSELMDQAFIKQKYTEARRTTPSLPSTTTIELRGTANLGTPSAVTLNQTAAAEAARALALTPVFTEEDGRTVATVDYSFSCTSFAATPDGVWLDLAVIAPNKEAGAINGRLVLQRRLPSQDTWEDVELVAERNPVFSSSNGAWRYTLRNVLTLPGTNCMFRPVIYAE